MTSFLASQSTLKGLSNKFDGKIPVRVHFLDNSSKVFLVETGETTTKDVVRMCLDKCGVDDAENVTPYFALFESKNGSTVDGLLPMDSKVANIVDRWAAEGVDQTAKFLFMIRMFMPCIWGLQYKDVVAFRLHQPATTLSMESYLEAAETIDVNCLHLQFMQAVYLIITGKLPTKQEQALELAAIHFLSKFGGYNPTSHQPGFLGARIVEFIPIKHLRGGLGGVTVEEWEAKLLAKVQEYAAAATDSAGTDNQEHSGDNGDNGHGASGAGKQQVYFRRNNGQPISPQRKYMESIYSMVPLYGCTFFRCSQRVTRVLPEVVQLGIHQHGLGVFDKSKRLVRMFHIEDIFRWGFKPNQMFYYEISAENDMGTGSLEFETDEGKVMSDLLTDYAMAFLKEREKEDERQELMKTGKYNLHSAAPTLFSSGNEAPSSAPPPLPSSSPPPLPSTAPPTEADRQQAAAVRMQALARGFLLRNDWAREDSAILIQTIFRGYRARILLSQMIEQLIQAGDL